MKPGIRLTLFWRVFLLIWLAMAVTVIAGQGVTHLLQDRERQSIERQSGLREVAVRAAALREAPDKGRFWRFLREEGQRLDLHLRLVEASNDEDLPQVIRERLESSGWYHLKPAVISVSDGYQLVAWPRKGAEGWIDDRVYRWLELTLAFFIITLACWWVARLVSRPLKHMESTAKDIAGGQTHLRVSDQIAARQDEIGALATAFNAMTERLCHLLERQSHLLRDISHDLRTPLARQRIAIELASDNALDEDLMSSILRQNERLEAMTSQILMLYSVSDEGSDIDRKPVSVSHILNQVLADAADYAKHQRVECKLTMASNTEAAQVLGDAHLLQRALDNILQNALDHSPPGHPVRVNVSAESDRLVLDIADEGNGVPEDVLAHLFEPFYRADKSRGGKGWGLGLAIARDILELHEGGIRAFNAEDGGLVVRLTLPVLSRD